MNGLLDCGQDRFTQTCRAAAIRRIPGQSKNQENRLIIKSDMHKIKDRYKEKKLCRFASITPVHIDTFQDS
jgi:hypothetical protein